jgi:hypothetical protein
MYGIRLPRSGSAFTGSVLLQAERTGIHHVYLGTPNVPFAVVDISTGLAVTALESERLDCTKLRRVLSFRFERGHTYRLALGPLTPASWVRLYVEGGIEACELSPARLLEAEADALRPTSILYYYTDPYPVLADHIYVLELNPTRPRAVAFSPPRAGDYTLFLGSPTLGHDLVTGESSCAKLASCQGRTGEGGSLIRSSETYSLQAGTTYQLTFDAAGEPGASSHVRFGFYDTPAPCAVNNGGCDSLTSCDSPDGVAVVCGTCPDGYAGDGDTGCADIDECSTGTDDCDSDPDACVNTPGSFRCVCPAEQPGPGYGEQGCEAEPDGPRLSLGNNFGCAYWADGHVKCWGENSSGQLGLGDRLHRGDEPGEMGASLPFVDTGVPVKQVETTALDSVCALGVDGLVRCWGANWSGLLGYGSNRPYVGRLQGEMGANLRPLSLGSDIQIAKLVGGDKSMCALTTEGTIKCWGDNAQGQLGLGDKLARGADPALMGDALPTVDLGTGFVAADLVCGAHSCCALSNVGRVKCWGGNFNGGLGLELPTYSAVSTINCVGDESGEMGNDLPYVDLGTGQTVISLHSGIDFTCAVLTGSGVKCWGDNLDGGVGYGREVGVGDDSGEMGDHLPFVDLGSNAVLRSLSSGTGGNMCAVENDGQLRCWGGLGGLGFPATNPRGDGSNEMGDSLPFLKLGTGRRVLDDVRGRFFGCASLDDASIKCWGSNRNGALGVGDTRSRAGADSDMGDNLPSLELGK